MNGLCRLCGCYGPLTFEHIPPKRAFNDRPIISYRIERMLADDAVKEIGRPTGGTSRRGAGSFTLCESCNTKTGAWYGSAYVKWAYEGVRLLDMVSCAPSLSHLIWCQPLRVIKQVVCMFFCINAERFGDVHPQLRKFVLNPKEKYWPSNARLYFGLCRTPSSKHVGVSGIGDFSTGDLKVVSEIMHPPFCYVLSFSGGPTHKQMYDMTHFSNFSFEEYRDFWITVPVLESGTPFPGDYRNRKSVYGV